MSSHKTKCKSIIRDNLCNIFHTLAYADLLKYSGLDRTVLNIQRTATLLFI